MKFIKPKYLLKFVSAVTMAGIIGMSFCLEAMAEEEEVRANQWKPELLNAIGISALSGTEYISRADFLALAMQAANIDAMSEKTSFKDIDTKTDAGRYVATAEQAGYANVPENKKFNPGEVITSTDAAVFCLRILGYGEAAELSGGYPDGYRRLSAKFRLTDGVKAKDFITMDDAAQMLYNMLFSTYADEAYSTDSVDYIESNDTFISHIYGIEKITGTVESICGIAFNTIETQNENTVVIDGIAADNQCCTDYKYLGKRAECYIKEPHTNDAELIYIRPTQNDRTLEINAGDITKVSGFSTDKGKNALISYNDKNNRGRNALISVGATVVKNLEECISVSDTDLTPQSGLLNLTDSNSDGIYDVVFIESFDYYYVQSVNGENVSITDKNGKETIYFEDFRKSDIIYNGKFADINAIAEGYNVGILCSYRADGRIDVDKRLRAVVLDGRVSGTVTALDRSSEKLYIDENEYTISPSFTDEIYIGSKNTFILGIENEVVFIGDYDFDSTNSKYGYLVAIGRKRQTDKTVQLKLYTTGNTMEVYSTEEKVVYKGPLNGEYKAGKGLDADEIIDSITGAQLVKYTLNEENHITELAVAYDYTAEDNYDGFDKSRFSLDYKAAAGRLYNGIATENYFFNSSSMVFVVPSSGDDEEQFTVGKQSVFGVNVPGVNLTLYDANEKMAPAIAVIKVENGINALSAYSDFCADTKITVINKKKSFVDENGDVRTKLYGVNNGLNVELVARNEEVRDSKTTNWKNVSATYFKDIQPGDIIQYRTGLDGCVDLVHILFSYNENQDRGGYIDDDGSGFISLLNTTYGKVSKFVPGSYFMLEGSTTRKFLYPACNSFVIYDLQNNSVKVLKSLDYLDENDFVFVSCRRTVVNGVVVFRR